MFANKSHGEGQYTDKMVAAVEELMPELLPLVPLTYGSPSSLFVRDNVIHSLEGVQQGDSLGPLLFCVTIHNMVQLMQSELNLFYLNDGTLGGALDEALHDFQTAEQTAGELGSISTLKRQKLCHESSTQEAML